MRQSSNLPRRTALAIAAASAGLTLAVTVTVAGSLGLIAPTSAAATPGPVEAAPSQAAPPSSAPPSAPADDRANLALGAGGQPVQASDSRAASRSARPARRDDNDNDDEHERERTVRDRRSTISAPSAQREAIRVVSRARHEDDGDDD